MSLTRRDLSEIIPLALSEDETERFTAILDLLYIFGRETRARNSLREILFGRRNALERLGDALRGRRLRAERREEEFRTLMAVFSDPGTQPGLADFVIAQYPQEWAIILVDLLSRRFFEFRGWLAREGRRAHARPGVRGAP